MSSVHAACTAKSQPTSDMTITSHALRAVARATLVALCVFGCGVPPTAPGVGRPPAAETRPSANRTILLEFPTDAELERRLTGIYEQVEGLDDVRIRVHEGVVHLAGSVGTSAQEHEAVDLASRLDGVAYVRNEIERSEVDTRLAPLWRSVSRMGRATIAALPEIAAAVVVFIPFLLLSLSLRRWRRPLQRFGVSPITGSLFRLVMRFTILLIGVLLSFHLLGIMGMVGALLGALGLLGLATGLAFKDWLANYFPGMMLGLHPPFKSGDLVQLGDIEGRVVRLSPRVIVLLTPDGTEIQIPNANLFRDTLINYSEHRERRLHFTVSLAPTADLDTAHEVGREALLLLRGVLHEPPPFMQTHRLERGAIEVEFFAWVDQEVANFRSVESRARRAVHEALIAAGIPFPELVPAIAPAHIQGPPEGAEDRDSEFLSDQLKRARASSKDRDLLAEGARGPSREGT
ncbi:MAG: mechanosensitive ion channel family protein [Kofleriaceae bacterium]|nr:mechanosensitive ion channel family protein [Kofleriaceae bacterium]